MSALSAPRADRWWTIAAFGYDPAVALVGWHRWQHSLVGDVTHGVVLDIGCGPAHIAKGLMERGVDYVGLDRNRAMLAQAAHALDSWGPGRGLLVRADVTAMPFSAASFDVVVATGVLGLLTVSVRRLVLREMTRVSRGDVRLLEPMLRPGWPERAIRSRAIALVRDRPIALHELAEAGLEPRVSGPPVLAGVYSLVRASFAQGGRG